RWIRTSTRTSNRYVENAIDESPAGRETDRRSGRDGEISARDGGPTRSTRGNEDY
ncbi:unnamed protein product, partial [Amoebophrya sp. A25]